MTNGEKKQNNKEKTRLQEILSYVGATDLEYVHLEKDGMKIIFKRSDEAIAGRKPSAAEQEQALAKEAKLAEEEAPKLFLIRSPIVGRFYSSMGADRPPLVVEGGLITAGQKVAIVEAMKIKKEVFSAITGRVIRIPVRDGDPVEYGQELFVVEPTDNGNS